MEAKKKLTLTIILGLLGIVAILIGLIATGILRGKLPFDDSTSDMLVELEFWVDETVLEEGECTNLHWSTSGGTVYVEGVEQADSGRMKVCPAESTLYKLELENPPNNPIGVKTVQINVSSPQSESGSDETDQSTESGNPDEIIFNFWVDETSLVPGDCTVLHWETAGGNTFLNGQGQPAEGEQEVCPAQSEDYQLVMEYPEDNVLGMQTITIEVQESANDPSSSSGGSTAFQADVAITDIYPSQLPYGAFHLRITNNGPGTLSKALVSVTCTSNQTDKNNGQVSFGGEDQFTVKLSLKPGETESISTDLTLDITVFDYVVGCEITPSFEDPESGNNEYSEPIEDNQSSSSSGDGNADFVYADLAVTDIYPESLPAGDVFIRITNHGPDAIDRAIVGVNCTAVVTDNQDPGAASHIVGSSMSKEVTLNPGQTQVYHSGIGVMDSNRYHYDMTCTINAVSLYPVDMNDSNNSYQEPIP